MLICRLTLEIRRSKNRNWLAYNLNRQTPFAFLHPIPRGALRDFLTTIPRCLISISFWNGIQDACTRVSRGVKDISYDRGLSLWANSISGPNQIPRAAYQLLPRYIHRTQNPKSLCERYVLSRHPSAFIYTHMYIQYTRTYIYCTYLESDILFTEPWSCDTLLRYVMSCKCVYSCPGPLLVNEFPML